MKKLTAAKRPTTVPGYISVTLEYGHKCKACGQVFRSATGEELAKHLAEHQADRKNKLPLVGAVLRRKKLYAILIDIGDINRIGNTVCTIATVRDDYLDPVSLNHDQLLRVWNPTGSVVSLNQDEKFTPPTKVSRSGGTPAVARCSGRSLMYNGTIYWEMQYGWMSDRSLKASPIHRLQEGTEFMYAQYSAESSQTYRVIKTVDAVAMNGYPCYEVARTGSRDPLYISEDVIVKSLNPK